MQQPRGSLYPPATALFPLVFTIVSLANLGCGEPHYPLDGLPEDAIAIVEVRPNETALEAGATFSLRAESGCIDLGSPLRILLNGFPATDQTGGEAGICRANAAWDRTVRFGEHEILVERDDFGRAVRFSTEGEILFCGFPNCEVEVEGGG